MRNSLLALFALGFRTNAFAPSRAYRLYSATPTSLAMAKKVLVPIAEDSEEIETVCISDTLTRFGADVTIASVMPGGELMVRMSRGVKIEADIHVDDLESDESWDLIALPGGMPGANHLRDSEALSVLLEKQKKEGKPYAAICAAPAVVLASKGLIEGDGATCYPAPAFRYVLDKDMQSKW